MSNMTVEDRLAEKLKSAEFAAWFGEDDLRELVVKALDKAFFSRRTIGDTYHRREVESLLVDMATEHVGKRIDQLVVTAVKEKLAEEPGKLEAIVANAMRGGVDELLKHALFQMAKEALGPLTWELSERVKQQLRSGM